MVTHQRATAQKLRDLALLSGSAFEASADPQPGNRGDELFVFNNAVAGLNEQPSATYYYDQSASLWRSTTAPTSDAGDATIAPGVFRTIRAASGAATTWWHSGHALIVISNVNSLPTMTSRTKTPWAGRCLALGILLGTSALSSASVSLNYQFITPELPAGTRCLLVASTQDSSFGQPGDLAGIPLTPGAVFAQDNLVLAVFTAESLPGAVTGVSGMLTLDYSGQLDAGDQLRLYWLPGLAPSATVIPLGSGFVNYRAEVAADGGTMGYALPADGATESLYSIATIHGGTTSFPGSVPATIATYPHDQDTDGDQLGDLLEFAMGLDPYVSNTPDQPMLAYDNGGASLSVDFALRR